MYSFVPHSRQQLCIHHIAIYSKDLDRSIVLEWLAINRVSGSTTYYTTGILLMMFYEQMLP